MAIKHHRRVAAGTLAATLLSSFILWACARQDAMEVADLVLLNGNIITVDPADRIAEAVAIRQGLITAVGSNAEIESRVGPRTQVIDLEGLTATPGLIDAHLHLSLGSARRQTSIDLSYPTVRRITDVRDAIAARAAELGGAEWIQGAGWDEGKLEERMLLTARDLDGVADGHPVWLMQTTGHYGVANSEALRLARIDRTTPNPEGGVIDRFPDGTPTGILKESAMELIEAIIPPPTQEQIEAGIKALAADLLSEGMTAVKDPLVRPLDWDAYQRLHGNGELGVRVFALWAGGTTLESARALIARIGEFTRPGESTGDDHLIAGGVKLFMDGSGGARTAWMHSDWNKNGTEIDEGNRGAPASDPDVLRQQVRLFHDAGLHLGIHAVGDRAIDWLVDSYAEALAANPVRGRRHSIIHANIPTDHALAVMADLQRRYDAGYPEPSASFMWWIGDTYAANFGPERALRLNPFQTYLQRGIRWAGGSDYFVTPFPARYGLWASVARETLLGTYGKTPWGMAESIDIRAALKSFTTWASSQLFLERKIGSIEVGKYADIAVWDRDPYNIPAAEIKEMQCQLTILDGRIVFLQPGATLRMSPAHVGDSPR